MTSRSSFEQLKKETGGRVFGFLANKGLSRRTTGIDGVAKKLLASQVGEVPHDPELDHPAEWDRPVD